MAENTKIETSQDALQLLAAMRAQLENVMDFLGQETVRPQFREHANKLCEGINHVLKATTGPRS